MKKKLENKFDKIKTKCFWRLDTGWVCMKQDRKYTYCNGKNHKCEDFISNETVRGGDYNYQKLFGTYFVQ